MTITALRVSKWLLMLGISAAVISIPWEFMRLFQKAVAARAAKIVQGAPPECSPENWTIFESISRVLVSQFSWTHAEDPCQEYYYALLVDPLWEVTPAMVLVSAFTRCCLHPLELLSGTFGNCLQLFFSEIPFQWQPFFLIFFSVIIFVLLLMLFGYQLVIPFIFRLEPRRLLCRQNCVKNTNYHCEIARETHKDIHCNEGKQLLLSEAASGGTPVCSFSRLSCEVMFNQNQCPLVSQSDKDCKSRSSKKDLNSNNVIQSFADGNLNSSGNKKPNIRDILKLPVSETLIGKAQKKKHQTLDKFSTVMAINAEKDKSSIPLKSRKCSVTKKKSKLDSLWTPRSEDYLSSDSE